MAFKTNPKLLRLKRLEDWETKGFYGKKESEFLREDFEIRKLIKEKFGKQAMIEKIEIERFPGKITVRIFTARPGLIIGRGGEGAENLKKEIEKKILKREGELNIEIKEVKSIWSSAPLVAQWVAIQLEKRNPYRRTIKQALSRVMGEKGVEGAKIQVSGRLDGVDIARTEWVKQGKLPRTTLRADIDYALEVAQTRVGTVGVKVWIYKGEKEI
jgi:small subunit ribosomal protein S3